MPAAQSTSQTVTSSSSRDPKPLPSRPRTGLRSNYVFTTRPQPSSSRASPQDTREHVVESAPLLNYPVLLKQPFADPLQIICETYNVIKPTLAIKSKRDGVPDKVNVEILRASSPSNMVTHALVILDTPRGADSKQAQAVLYPITVPINIDVFAKAFDNELIRQTHHATTTNLSTSSTRLSPNAMNGKDILPPRARTSPSGPESIPLPTITTRVPHPPSIPLLVLFGLGPYLPVCESTLSSLSVSPSLPLLSDFTPTSRIGSATIQHPSAHMWCTGLLATYLLPVAVIEEFPAAAAMADVMARTCSDEELAAYVVQNQGMWRNALLLAPKDPAIIEIVRTAWNVTAEARRVRDRLREGETESTGKERKAESDGE